MKAYSISVIMTETFLKLDNKWLNNSIILKTFKSELGLKYIKFGFMTTGPLNAQSQVYTITVIA